MGAKSDIAWGLTEVESLMRLEPLPVAIDERDQRDGGVQGGRRYPGALVRAAFRLRAPGSLERLREALDAFDTVGVEPLKNSIFRWRKTLSVPAR
jgi:hypothetical protein